MNPTKKSVTYKTHGMTRIKIDFSFFRMFLEALIDNAPILEFQISFYS